MKTCRNLTYVILVICLISFGLIVSFAGVQGNIAFIGLNLSTTIFAVGVVALALVLGLYFHMRAAAMVVLKRRGGRSYGELIHHMMNIIDVMDGRYSYLDIRKVLYTENAFMRIRKFLYEEYYLLMQYDPFLYNSKVVQAVHAFECLHMEFTYFIRSVADDQLEYSQFKKNYVKVYGHAITPATPEEEFFHPELKEAYEHLLMGYEYALFNVEKLMELIDQLMTNLDKVCPEGAQWSHVKASFQEEFQRWAQRK